MKKIYLAGKMRGIPGLNHKEFNRVSEKLRSEGHVVFNPAEVDIELGLKPNDNQTHTPKDIHKKIMSICCEFICTEATHIYLLPGWSDSRGATAERSLGIALDLSIVETENV